MPPASSPSRTVRPAVAADLAALEALYDQLNPARPPLPRAAAAAILGRILASRECLLLVAEADGTLAATCMLAVLPNLMRGGRPHALLENVVADAARRRQGHGRAVVRAALAEAWARGAHHVMLLTGRADPAVHRFYESCGFVAGRKTGYVALAPTA